MNKQTITGALILFLVLIAACSETLISVPLRPTCSAAHFFAHTNITLPVILGVWRNITFDQEETDLIAGASHDPVGRLNYTFNITESGIYKFQYFMSYTDSSPSPTSNIATRVIRNGIEINGSTFEIDTTRQDAETEGSNTIHVRIDAGDSIAYQFIADDSDVALETHSTFGQHPDSATITMSRIECT